MGEKLDFRRRKRPGWIRSDEGPAESKRLKGLDEFEKPEFVGRMDRVAAAEAGMVGTDAGGCCGWRRDRMVLGLISALSLQSTLWPSWDASI